MLQTYSCGFYRWEAGLPTYKFLQNVALLLFLLLLFPLGKMLCNININETHIDTVQDKKLHIAVVS